MKFMAIIAFIISLVSSLLTQVDPNKIYLSSKNEEIILSSGDRISINVELTADIAFPIIITHSDSLVYFSIVDANESEILPIEMTVLRYDLLLPGKRTIQLNIDTNQYNLDAGRHLLVLYSIFTYKNQQYHNSIKIDLIVEA